MNKFERIIDNPFEQDVNITDNRIVETGDQVSENLQGAFPDLSAEIDAALEPFSEKIAGLAASIAARRGRTLTVDQASDRILETLRRQEPGIEYAFGGKETEGYRAFFPDGLTEYKNMSKTGTPELLARIRLAVNTYGADLDLRLKNELLALETQWQRSREAQRRSKAAVQQQRIDLDAARKNLERALLKAMHTVALARLDDLEAARALFPFHLLYAAAPASTEAAGGRTATA